MYVCVCLPIRGQGSSYESIFVLGQGDNMQELLHRAPWTRFISKTDCTSYAEGLSIRVSCKISSSSGMLMSINRPIAHASDMALAAGVASTVGFDCSTVKEKASV